MMTWRPGYVEEIKASHEFTCWPVLFLRTYEIKNLHLNAIHFPICASNKPHAHIWAHLGRRPTPPFLENGLIVMVADFTSASGSFPLVDSRCFCRTGWPFISHLSCQWKARSSFILMHCVATLLNKNGACSFTKKSCGEAINIISILMYNNRLTCKRWHSPHESPRHC